MCVYVLPGKCNEAIDFAVDWWLLRLIAVDLNAATINSSKANQSPNNIGSFLFFYEYIGLGGSVYFRLWFQNTLELWLHPMVGSQPVFHDWHLRCSLYVLNKTSGDKHRTKEKAKPIFNRILMDDE